jgi:hypothetical protein
VGRDLCGARSLALLSRRAARICPRGRGDLHRAAQVRATRAA